MCAKHHKMPGTAPGTLVAPKGALTPKAVHVIHYGQDSVVEADIASVEELARLRDGKGAIWVNVDGFMPLTFLAGVYGMNFRHLPEVEWRWGYLAFWLAIVIVTLLMLWLFRRKGWLGGGRGQ